MKNCKYEVALLGGIIFKNDIIVDVIDIIDVSSFEDIRNKTIFAEILDIYRNNRPIDLLTVGQSIESKGLLSLSGGSDYLVEIASSVISASNTIEYARIVAEKARKRGLQLILKEASESLHTLTAKEVSENIESFLLEREEDKQNDNVKYQSELVNSVIDKIEKRTINGGSISGISYGYPSLDEFTGGLNKGELTILGARPSVGKTALALNIANNISSSGKNVLFFSLEMSAEDITQRLLCLRSGVSLFKVRNGGLEQHDFIKLSQQEDIQCKLKLFIDDSPRGLNTLEMRSKAKKLSMREGVDVIIVDYLQLIKSGKDMYREQEIADISRSLKALSKELNIPVIALAQLNRGVEQRTDKKPLLSDLRESGSIEQDADVIMFIHREDVYRKGEEHPKKGIADIIIGKNRNGATGDIELRYVGHTTKFEEI